VSTLLGQESVLETLRAAASADRLPHALLFAGPEGVGKRTAAEAFAREFLTAGDPEAAARFDRRADDRYLLYADLARPLPVRRADLLGDGFEEEDLLKAYTRLTADGWIEGVSAARGEGVIDLIRRDPARFTGRKGIPFAEILEKGLAGLEKARKLPPRTAEVARRLFSPGTAITWYRRRIGIDLIHGRGDGAYFRTVASLLATTANGARRVAVLDDAHTMSVEAENAFLKTLEEPPPGTLLILVTSEPLSLLPTTLSRCARIVFGSIREGVLREFLAGTQGVGPEDAALLASMSEGSVRRALELRDLDISRRSEGVTEVLQAIAEGRAGTALSIIGTRVFPNSGKGRDRDDIRRDASLFLELLAVGCRDMVLARSVPGFVPGSGMAPDEARRLTLRIPAGEWSRLFDRVGEAREDIERGVESRLAVEAVFMELPTPAKETS
jgi:DNA polymerase III delta prime subunit